MSISPRTCHVLRAQILEEQIKQADTLKANHKPRSLHLYQKTQKEMLFLRGMQNILPGLAHFIHHEMSRRSTQPGF